MWYKHRTCLSKSLPKSCSAKPSSLSLSRRAAAEKGDGVVEVEDEDESAARRAPVSHSAESAPCRGKMMPAFASVEVKRRPKAHLVLNLKIDIISTMVSQNYLLI